MFGKSLMRKIQKKAKPAVSVVIPAYNEEKYLPKLLASIRAQDFKDLEIIVSMKPSKDKTLQIARQYGCRIATGGDLPASTRNNGAKIAKADLILFFDADTVLPPNFISPLLAEFERKKLGCASVLYSPVSNNLFDKFSFFVINAKNWIVQRINPSASAWCILIKTNIFNKIRGFDESLKYFEDEDLVQKASKLGKFSIIAHLNVMVSVRRFEKEGRLAFNIKWIWLTFLKAFLGNRLVQGKVKYEFGKF
jgi:glycosyltransferase involved in cell wall biosynthesis